MNDSSLGLAFPVLACPKSHGVGRGGAMETLAAAFVLTNAMRARRMCTDGENGVQERAGAAPVSWSSCSMTSAAMGALSRLLSPAPLPSNVPCVPDALPAVQHPHCALLPLAHARHLARPRPCKRQIEVHCAHASGPAPCTVRGTAAAYRAWTVRSVPTKHGQG